MNEILQTVLAYIDGQSRAIVDLRRRLHAIPELGFREQRTAAFVEETLRSYGLVPNSGVAGTGLTARLSFARPGPAVLLRADMDALPVCEATGLDFASEHEGCMHACGHDGHMAMVLGAAGALSFLAASEQGKELGGSVIFAFQPAEEGQGGAKPMVQSGIMDGVDYCLAGHIWPDLELGQVGLRSGPLMASVHMFRIDITGKGGHGSQPHRCSDALDGAAQLACALQHIVSRRIDPMLPAVLTVGSLKAGDAHNVIPQTAQLTGCARGFHPEVVGAFEGHIRQIARGICDSAGLQCEVHYTEDDGPVVNDPFVVETVRKALSRFCDKNSLVEPSMSMTGEDFSRYLAEAPGCMLLFGSGGPDSAPLHSPEFSFDDHRLLPHGTKAFCAATLELLTASQA